MVEPDRLELRGYVAEGIVDEAGGMPSPQRDARVDRVELLVHGGGEVHRALDGVEHHRRVPETDEQCGEDGHEADDEQAVTVGVGRIGDGLEDEHVGAGHEQHDEQPTQRLGGSVVTEDEKPVHQEPRAGGVRCPAGAERLHELREHGVRLVVEVEREVVERPPGEVGATARSGRGAKIVQHHGERVDAVDEGLHPAVRMHVPERSVEAGRTGGEPTGGVEQLQVRPRVQRGDHDRAAGGRARPAILDGDRIDVPSGLVAGVHGAAGRDAAVVSEPAHRDIARGKEDLARGIGGDRRRVDPQLVRRGRASGVVEHAQDATRCGEHPQPAPRGDLSRGLDAIERVADEVDPRRR